jgi:hypothetical protein
MGRSLKLGCLVLGQGLGQYYPVLSLLSLKIGGTREDVRGRSRPSCPTTKHTLISVFRDA